MPANQSISGRFITKLKFTIVFAFVSLTFNYVHPQLYIQQGGVSGLPLSVRSTDIKTIVGEYKWCRIMLCQFIQIFPDSTFDYRIYGDPYNGVGCFGKITNIGEDLYLANSDEQPYPLVEKYDTLEPGIKVVVMDEKNDPVESATVNAFTTDETLIGFTNKKGVVQFSKNIIKKLWVDNLPKVVYSPESANSNSFEIKLRDDTTLIYVTNENWKIKNDKLEYINGWRFPLSKVN